MFLKSFVRSRLTYGCHAWRPSHVELNKIESTYRYFMRCMIWNGHARVNPPPRQSANSSSDELDEIQDDVDWSYIISNEKLYHITQASTIQEYMTQQQINWISHIIRRENNNVCKILTFHSTKRTKLGRKNLTVLERAVKESGLSLSQLLKSSNSSVICKKQFSDS